LDFDRKKSLRTLELSETIPVWQLPQYKSEKTREKRELDEDILGLKRLESQTRCSFELALRTTNVSSKQLNDYCELRASLEKPEYRWTISSHLLEP
jgi:hypothetical protein